MSDPEYEPTAKCKQTSYRLIESALWFRRAFGKPRSTPEEIAAVFHLDVNGTATRLPEMKKRGFPIACGRREGTRKKEWWLV